MVEAGQIDWAAHANDVGAMLHEMIKMEHTLEAILAWAKTRDDTLVVVTADHETGGFGLSYSRYNIPKKVNLEGKHFKEKGYQYAPNFNFGALETLDAFYSQKKSLVAMYEAAIAEGADHPTPKALVEQVNRYSGFKITLEEAKQVLVHKENIKKIAGHAYLNEDRIPKFNDFEHFYVYGEDDHSALLARALAKHQNVVWGTGTHTHTPVPVYAYGPDKLARQYSRQLHHARLGRMLQAHLLGLSNRYVQTKP